MTILGIDPGLSGGLALYDGSELLVWDMPTFALTVNGGQRKRIDTMALRRVLMEYRPDHAVIERVNAQPGNGTASAFAYGYGVGVVDAVVQCCEVPVTHVTPQRWKKALGVPKDKDGARARAGQLLPRWSHCWQLKRQDGIAEAALLALYGFTSPTTP